LPVDLQHETGRGWVQFPGPYRPAAGTRSQPGPCRGTSPLMTRGFRRVRAGGTYRWWRSTPCIP